MPSERIGIRCYKAYHSAMTTTPTPPPPDTDTKPASDVEQVGVSPLQVLQSTFAAALGVQSSKNRQRDFAEGRASQFIVAGIVFTALFVGVMVLIVRLVLSSSTAH